MIPLVPEIPELKPKDFHRICSLAYERFGLNLREGKERLVSSRLAKLMRTGGFRSFDAYFDYVLSDRSGDAMVAMIDCLTTNHTSFLRESQHFAVLGGRLTEEFGSRRPFRIWSAAASTGEEPYSIACTVLASPHLRGSLEILATDISTRVLACARRATYSGDRVANLPPDWLHRFFTPAGTREERAYRVKPEVAGTVRFERLNLIEPFPARMSFPVIFCRNVMIYFDRSTRAALVRKLVDCLEPGGYLLVGHAESLIGMDHGLVYVMPAVYRRGGAPAWSKR